MADKRIEPRTLKGFRDYLPETMIPREHIIAIAKRVYRSYGFSPIDTPALEYEEILSGKTGTEDQASVAGAESERQMYRFEDHGGRKVGMRFDLTVPLARFVAQHINELGTPFKRYHIAAVWRGENTQRGRYREFMQCDFDTIGTKSLVADIETALVIHDLLLAIGFKDFTLRLNNRLVLNGLLDKLGISGQANAVLRGLDKLAKVGPDRVIGEIVEATGAARSQAEEILAMVQLSGTNEQVLLQLERLVQGNETGELGVAQLGEILRGIREARVPSQRFQLDVSIARGLDYYTGTVLETFLDALPDIGSICSGGRYDNLAELYTSQQLPGIGASLGLDRLLAAMEELKLVEPVRTPADVFLVYFDRQRLSDYLRLARQVRAAGLGVEFYPEPKKLGQQLKYADRRGFRVALIAGENEFSAGTCQVKDLASGGKQDVPLSDSADELVSAIRALLTEPNAAAAPPPD